MASSFSYANEKKKNTKKKNHKKEKNMHRREKAYLQTLALPSHF
jgi:hypothetical protein